MISRCAPQAPPDSVFTSTAIELLERVVPDLPLAAQLPPLLRNLIKVARLGGYLARASDASPGNTVMWRGMRRLTDIQLGAAVITRLNDARGRQPSPKGSSILLAGSVNQRGPSPVI